MIGHRPMTGSERVKRSIGRPRLTPEQVAANVLNPTGQLGPPPLPEAKLRNLELDVALREAYYVSREKIEPPLHAIAEAVSVGLRDFPKRFGRTIAAALGRSQQQVTPRLRAQIVTHLRELGDLHTEIKAALDTAATRWRRFPPQRDPNDPPLPDWVKPESKEESDARASRARSRLEEIRTEVQTGLLLAQWPARAAAGNVLIGWRSHCLEWFPTRSGPLMLAGLGLDVTRDLQWIWFRAVQAAMRTVLAEIAATVTVDELAESIRPPEEIPISEWADRYRMLSTRSSAEPGPYRTDRTPYLKAIMDDLSPTSPVQRVVVKKAAQIGTSECGNNWIGATVDLAPGPALIVQPTVELAKRFSQQRVDTLFEESPRLRHKIRPARSKDSGNTILMKEFLGGVLVLTGGNSAVGLRSMPVRYLMLDEVDAYPPDAGDEGDPVALAEARQRTFSFRAKSLVISTPKIKNASRISREYEASDQRRFFVPCPECHVKQPLEFNRLRWQQQRPETAVYQCAHCNRTFAEHHKPDMLAKGEWRATAEAIDATVHGYHLSGLYSPLGWLSWADIAKQWEACTNDADLRKAFINTVLGEEYEEESEAVPDWQRLYERREDWPHHTVPERGLFLIGGADIQADRIEIDVWAWGRNLECWLVEHVVINGDPGRPEIWTQMDALLTRTWQHETGHRLALQRLAIDTGYATQSVYGWARGQDHSTVLPVRGYGATERLVPVTGPAKVEVLIDGRKLKRGLNLWTVSTSFFKKEIYKRLQLDKPTDEQLAASAPFPRGYIHLSQSASDEWCRQLVAEQQVIVRDRRGFQARTEWRLLRPRNEALDCLVYARAAVWLAGADRWAEARWRNLEEQLGLSPPPSAPPPPAAPSPAAPPAGVIQSAAPSVASVIWRPQRLY